MAMRKQDIVGSVVKKTQDIEAVKPYKLYIGTVNTPIPDGVEYSFVPSNLKYLLVYTNSSVSPNFTLVDEEKLNIPTEVEDWLFSVKTRVNKEYLKSKKAETDELFNCFFNLCEIELQKEQDRVENGKKSGGES